LNLRRWLFYLLCFGLALYLTILPGAQQPAASGNKNPHTTTEIRGVWLTNVGSGVLFVPWGIDRALSQLSALNFNTIYPVVWNRGNTFYKSNIAKKTIGADAQPLLNFLHGGKDVLAKISKISAAKDLRVIPWFEYGFMTPTNSALAKRHPEWLTNGKSGIKSIQDAGIDFDESTANKPKKVSSFQTIFQTISRQYLVTEQVWLNPLHPEVQNFIKSLILEVVKNYDVDGIQIDDHFGMPVQFGYDKFTIQLYQQEHEGKNPPKNFLNSEWMRWRADKITEFITEINKAVKSVNSNAKISLSPNSHPFAYNYYLQDWETWVKRGLVDELVLQVYRDDSDRFLAELKQIAVQSAWRKIPVAVGIFTGNWRNPVEIKQIKKQVDLARQHNFDGVSFFYWESLWGYITPESPRQRRKSFLDMFTISS
jgi:uncharacterized lipoprotein YddW (UPF0748 family)